MTECRHESFASKTRCTGCGALRPEGPTYEAHREPREYCRHGAGVATAVVCGEERTVCVRCGL